MHENKNNDVKKKKETEKTKTTRKRNGNRKTKCNDDQAEKKVIACFVTKYKYACMSLCTFECGHKYSLAMSVAIAL